MRHWNLGWALAACAIAAVGCGGGSKSSPPPAGAAKGVSGQYFYLTVAPAAGGTIASGDGAIACQPDGTGCGDATYHQTKFTWATPVVLTATPLAGFQFDSWTGDCSGTKGTVCTLPGTSADVDCSVAAVFKAVTVVVPPPAPITTAGRIYGYVKDGAGKGASGVTVSLNTTPTATTAATTATGAYVFEVAPGSYKLTTTANSQFLAATAVNVTLPNIKDTTNCVQGFYVPTSGVAVAPGCLVKVADIAVAGVVGYVAPVLPTVTASTKYLAGFNQTVTLGCTPAGSATFSKWVETAGPTIVDTSAWVATGQTFTTPTFASLVATTATANTDAVNCPKTAGNALPNKVGCGVSNLVPEGRLGFVSFNKQQAAELTYTFQCQASDSTKNTVNVQLASFVNANTATSMREASQPLSSGSPTSFNDKTAGQPKVVGPLWSAQSEQFTLEEDGVSTWRAHDGVNVPAGTIVVTDDVAGRASYNWKFCKNAKDTAASCVAPTITVPTINDANTPNAWFVVSWTPGSTLYLVNDAMPITVSGFAGKAVIGIKAATWTGFYKPLDAVANPEPCSVCHVAPGLCDANGANCELGPTKPAIDWKKSKHAGILIDGGSGTHYTSSCLPCHTLGYDPAMNNGGWDDIAAAQVPPYTLPDFPFEGTDSQIYFKNVPTAVQVVSNVQCENCHGPAQAGPDHTASLNSRTCAFCHDGGHHGLYSQWKQSGHANLAVAQSEGPSHGRDQTHCGRCHFAQGFMTYVDAIKSGNPDKLGNPPPSGAPAGALTTGILCSPAATKAADTCPNGQQAGLITNENVEAISCQTCHDSHSLELRISGDDSKTGLLLAGGFKVTNGGSGTICSVCHNSRNGVVGALSPNPNNSGAPYAGIAGAATQHNDATPLTSDSKTIPAGTAPAAVFGMTGPHTAAQADVYYGGNGYLLGQPMPTRPNIHADPTWFPDTCADCHVKRFTKATAAAGTVVNHTFGVDDNTCASCHGTNTWIEDRNTLVTAKLAAYQVSLATVLKGASITLVNGQLNGAVDASVPPKPVLADYTLGANTVKTVAVSGDRPLTLDITFSNGDVVAGCSIDKIMSGATPTLYTVSGTVNTYGKVAKSMYNFALIKNDNSFGIHNLMFVDAMFDAMVNHLDSTGLPK
jgi:Carboxypeptidase regulatory-like domain/Divergent InlB B-repeat domain